ncbi:MAG TPA: SxtJ family membrane protein [Bryobacteraceae bacterium]|nr:SxtJ family membrane protein [Bryobacteraceae bacterium]
MTERQPKTALLVAGVLAVLCAWLSYRSRWPLAAIAGGLSCALLFIGLFSLKLSSAFHRVWMRFATAIAYINSRVLLTILYFAVFTPYGFVTRLLGRDILNRGSPPRDSYWMKRSATRQTKDQFERLF